MNTHVHNFGDPQNTLSQQNLYEEIISGSEKNKIKNLSFYISFLTTNKQECLDFGIIFGEEKGQKTVHLTHIKYPQKNNLFGKLAMSSLRQISMCLGHPDPGQIYSISLAQDVLQEFFMFLGYRVILERKEKISLQTLRDHQLYFENNFQEFIDFGIVFGEENGEKTFDLANISRPKVTKLFGGFARTTLKPLGSIFRMPFKEISHKEDAKKILEHFFVSLNYKKCSPLPQKNIITTKKSPPKTFNFFHEYFLKHKNEFVNFGIIFGEANGEKTVNFSTLKSPQRNYLFGKLAMNSLREISICLGSPNPGQILTIFQAQEILKIFFEIAGYRVIGEKKEKIKFSTIQDYEQYIQNSLGDFLKMNIIFGEEKGQKTVNLTHLLPPDNHYLFDQVASIGLKNVKKIFLGHHTEPVRKIHEAQKVLKAFFEYFGYKVILEKPKRNQKKYGEHNSQESLNFLPFKDPHALRDRETLSPKELIRINSTLKNGGYTLKELQERTKQKISFVFRKKGNDFVHSVLAILETNITDVQLEEILGNKTS